jgi:hypothetical protein
VGALLIHVSPEVIYPSRSALMISIPFSTPTIMNYHLNNEEIKQFKEFYSSVNSRMSKMAELENRIITLAIKRFNNSYERYNHEDRLIDLMIAFEALYLPEKDELALRLALRTAVMLEKTREKRSEIYKYLKAAYNTRSNIVHGEPIGSSVKVGRNNIILEYFVDKIQQYARMSISAMIKALPTKSHKELIANLDDQWFE